MNSRELRSRRGTLLDIAEGMLKRATEEKRDLNFEEKSHYDTLISQADSLLREAEAMEARTGIGPYQPGPSYRGNLLETVSSRSRGFVRDEESRALAAYVRGDRSALQDLEGGSDNFDASVELRAVDSTMNITTAADGGAAVPTGFSGRVSARMNEVMLADRLGVQRVPGVGTTVNFPYENADPVVFAATAEQTDAHGNNYQRDTPVLNTKAFTLVKYTKKLELTTELLEDEDARLMNFISDWIGRAIGMTHNSLLLTEVAANGTALKTFASATAIAATEPDALVYNNALSYYLDDGGSIGWVMRPATHGAIKGITGNDRMYDETPAGAGKS